MDHGLGGLFTYKERVSCDLGFSYHVFTSLALLGNHRKGEAGVLLYCAKIPSKSYRQIICKTKGKLINLRN